MSAALVLLGKDTLVSSTHAKGGVLNRFLCGQMRHLTAGAVAAGLAAGRRAAGELILSPRWSYNRVCKSSFSAR